MDKFNGVILDCVVPLRKECMMLKLVKGEEHQTTQMSSQQVVRCNKWYINVHTHSHVTLLLQLNFAWRLIVRKRVLNKKKIGCDKVEIDCFLLKEIIAKVNEIESQKQLMAMDNIF